MNSSRLSDHFDRISEATYAIPKLRHFILDLAVRGKLVEQDSNDEPAARLLKRIQSEKAAMVTAGTIKKPKTLPPIDTDQLPFEIPPSWEWSRLADIASYIQRGKSPKYATGRGVPVISQNVSNGRDLTLALQK